MGYYGACWLLAAETHTLKINMSNVLRLYSNLKVKYFALAYTVNTMREGKDYKLLKATCCLRLWRRWLQPPTQPLNCPVATCNIAYTHSR